MGTVWGILPYFVSESKDGWGRVRGPFMSLPKNADSALIEHEKLHVKQWYVFFLIAVLFMVSAALIFFGIVPVHQLYAIVPAAIGMVTLFLPKLKFIKIRREWAAYGQSIRTTVEKAPNVNVTNMIDLYARILDTNENYAYEKNSLEQHRQEIRKRYESGGLF